MLDHPDPVEDDQRQHKRVFEAIKDRAPPLLAHEAMLDHIEHTRHEILRILKSETEQVS